MAEATPTGNPQPSENASRAASPAGDPEQKRRIRSMFDGVAHRYDFLNHFLSAGIDRRWRRRTVHELALEPGHRLLDLCTGTGDLGLEALRATPGLRVVGLDLARGMLVRGEAKRRRVDRAGPDRRELDGATAARAAMLFTQGDAERLPLPDASMDRACVGFGIRNVSSLPAAFTETARVLRPGGLFAVLEFTTPPNPVFRGLYHAYFHHLLPRVGGWVSGNGDAYRYLPDSVARFPDPDALSALARRCGFADAKHDLLQGGIAALHLCRR